MEYLLVDILELGEWHFTFYINVYSRYKGKDIPLEAMKAQGGCGYKGPHIRSHGTKR